MMKDDNQFDEVLRQAAQDYNRPPTVIPRDEMWAAIEAEQAKRASRPLHIVAPGSHRPMPRYVWIGAAAAVLLVAAGIGIGRWSTISVKAAGSVRPIIASNNSANIGTRTPPADQLVTPDVHGTEPSTLEPVRSTQQRGTQVRRGSGDGNRFAQAGSSRALNGAPRQEVPYQVATIRHLANAEALLTAFRTDSRDAKMDAQLSKWARDLLSNTRLLLDSPAADDPQRARLLGDLELVLAQIVQLSPGAAAQDRDLIEGSIQSGHVMTRLRSAIPAGPTRGL